VRRVLIWFGRVIALAIGVAVVTAAALLTIDMLGKHRLKVIAKRAPAFYVKEQPATLVLDHVRVIDGTGAALRDDQSIVIENGKNSYAGPHSGLPNIRWSFWWMPALRR
jgi:hypothetical protein